MVFWLLSIGMNAWSTYRASSRCWLCWQLSNFCIGRIEYAPGGGTDWGKYKVWIREYSPKTMNIVGVRTAHHSANSMYKDDNKISRQQKVLHMHKMLERVPHFQASFSVGIQPLS